MIALEELRADPPGISMPRWFVLATVGLGLAFAVLYQVGVPLRSTYGARINVDEPFYLLTTVSLLRDGDLDLTNDYALQRYRAFFDGPTELWTQSVPTPDGRLLSPHNVGLSALLVPAYALGGLDGAKAFLGLLGGATMSLTALLTHRATGRPRAALLATALLGLTAPILVYATQIYPELPAAGVVVLSVWLLLGQRPGLPAAIGLMLALTSLAWLGVKYVPLAAILGVLALVRLRARAAFAVLVLVSAASYIWFHLATYGGVTPYALNRLYAGDGLIDLVGQHLAIWNRLYRFFGLWIDAEFGLVRWAPVLLLIVPALVPLCARRGPVRWVWPALVVTQLLVAVFLSITMRGWWFPGRMLIVVLPLLAIPLADGLALASRRPVLASLAALLGAYSIGITAALVRAAGAGEVVLAVNPFTLAWPPFQVLAGLFPLFTEYSPATWLLSGAWLLGAGLVLRSAYPRLPVRPWRLLGQTR